MSSFPKHSFEQAYDHAFPPSPPNGNNNNNNSSATGSAVPSSATSPSQAYSNNNYNTNSLASPSGPGLSTISERSPLITKAPIQNLPGSYTSTNNNHDDDDDYHPNNNHHSHGTSVSSTDTLLEQGNSSSSGQYMSIRDLTVREFKILLRYSAPVVLTYVLQNSLQLASLVSLGHLGSIELAASSLASMFAAVTCWSVSLGTATALDTLCSQSYTSHHPHTLGLHLQRAILVLMVLFVPIAGVWLSSEYIFMLLGQEQALAQHAALFLRGLLPGAPAFLIFECVKKYLQAQGNMHASTYVLLIASPINVVLNYTLVWNKYIGMGYIGAPLATSISYWNMLILLLLYIRFVDGYQGWGGWSRDCLTGWPAFLKLALPGVMMVCTEWWAFEVVSLAASYLGTVALAAQSVVVQTSGLLYTVPFGISIAASNRVGNLIGLGDARSAKVAARVSIALSIIFGMVNSTMLIVFKDRWGRLFSEDADVVSTVAMVLPLVALFQISDGLAGVGGGVLRGVGLQHLGAYLNLIAYYLVAFPVGYLLAFKLRWGLKGLWSALCVALWMVGLGELFVIFKTNWRAEVIKCKERNDVLAKRTSDDDDEE
ncbi:MATE efflux family protein [Linnemannia elongata AG-77]|uniref:MATE efflux family protein n=1 Tax=Linnemannia elongata AG-77 TaxID=1314771 RepID=A0A197K8I1_9FUNG|nr:MATE efflux family protein [Linnemannia elongata AG-77]